MTTTSTNPSFGEEQKKVNNPSFEKTAEEQKRGNYPNEAKQVGVNNPNETTEQKRGNYPNEAKQVGVNNPNDARGNNPNDARGNNPYGTAPEAGVNNPNVVRGNNSYVESPEVRAHGGTPEGNTNSLYGATPEARKANSKFGAKPSGNTNYPYGATQEGNVNRPYGATQEGNVNRPYGATSKGNTTTFGETRFGVSFSGVTGKQQPLSMVSYKLFLRTGMYLKGNVLEGNPLTKAAHDLARADFEAELEALRQQVRNNERQQALALEFEPLRNNYWLNNNGYDQVYI